MTTPLKEKVPVYDVDFYSDAVIHDPYPYYAEMRALGPVVWLPQNGVFAVTRYQEVTEALRQPKRFISSKGLSLIPKVNNMLVGSTLNSDPPAHDRTRAVTSAPLLPGALKAVEGKIISAAEHLVTTLVQRGEFDAVTDFSQYLPLTIVAELVGLPDAGREHMLKWASATFNLFGNENERAQLALDDLQDLRKFLAEYGHPDKLKDGGWAKRIFEVGPDHQITTETCAQLMRDYINPSLDTTISATGHAIKLFAENPEQWQLIRENPELIPNAVEEVVRLESPIRAFSRYVAEDSELGGVELKEGSRILVVYASANRDDLKYDQADRFDIRRDNHNHVGFGHGVHMCMGMHLARLEIQTLLRLLAARVETIQLLGEPTIAMNNSIRAYANMPVRVHADKSFASSDTALKKPGEDHWIEVVVAEREHQATDIVSFILRSASQFNPLPPFEPGAHIDVRIRDGLIRQYSLSNNPDEQDSYRIAVLKDPDSKGGSTSLHNEVIAGSRLSISSPKNHFPLLEKVPHTILLAGGIGITPLLAMCHRLKHQSASFELHYCTSNRSKIAFTNDLQGFKDQTHFHISQEGSSIRDQLHSILTNAPAGTHVYTCGPNSFMEFARRSALKAGLSTEQVHQEYFGAEIDTGGDAFTLVLAKSDLELEVKPDETMADVIARAGIDVPMSCQSGVCGTCLTQVMEGTPDHRDLVQTDTEKASNKQVTVCCSRSKSRRLVVNL